MRGAPFATPNSTKDLEISRDGKGSNGKTLAASGDPWLCLGMVQI